MGKFDIFNFYLLLRMTMALAAGFIIGSERENKNKSAGTRTHTLVCLGACLAMIVSKYGFYDVEHFDAARIAAQIVSGVGFLGAGVIFVKNYGVTGLTTAAGIWTTSIIGMAFGSGMYFLGIIATSFIVFFQSYMFPGEIFQRHTQYTALIESNNSNIIGKIDAYIDENHLHKKGYNLRFKDEKFILNFQIYPKDQEELSHFITFLENDLHVEKFDIF
ncbi:MgtC/SapB family protein [uncultured Anaerococcus sp.]|uniref:MgtC/SapB family protein n=1 Tax=uncultured Anaerococcus sp. TaxID=293428 RepID=UPI00288BAF61|nr:MgtC/SapB family protein [uncultured Anaerococcus sp.]